MLNIIVFTDPKTGLYSAVDSASDCRSRCREFVSQLSHIIFVEMYEIISATLLPLPLIQEEKRYQQLTKVCSHVLSLINPLRKHAYLNLLKIIRPKKENFQIKISDIFHISAQNMDCGYSLEPPRRGGSNGYPQSMF